MGSFKMVGVFLGILQEKAGVWRGENPLPWPFLHICMRSIDRIVAVLSTVIADTEECSALCKHIGAEH